MSFRLCYSAAGLLLAMLCGQLNAEIAIDRVALTGWPDAYRVSNGNLELTVVPAVGRILELKLPCESNILWQGYTFATAPRRKDGWINAGGDRALPWPQSDWPERIGRIWPPPLAAEITPHQLEILPDKTIRMTSPIIPEYGVRLIRTIRMHQHKTQIDIETTLERAAPGPALAMSPWLITQCRADASTRVIASRISTAESLRTTTMLDRPWPRKREIMSSRSEFFPPGNVEAKAGLNAEILAVQTNQTLLTQRAISGQAETDNPERAQIFSPIRTQDGQPTGDNYVEIEFIGQPKMLEVGQRAGITVRWELSTLRK